MTRSLQEVYDERKTNTALADLPVGTKVRVATPCVDFYFFYGEIGKVVRHGNTHLPIIVKFDEPRHFEGGYIQREFNFKPCDLQVLDVNNWMPEQHGYICDRAAALKAIEEL